MLLSPPPITQPRPKESEAHSNVHYSGALIGILAQESFMKIIGFVTPKLIASHHIFLSIFSIDRFSLMISACTLNADPFPFLSTDSSGDLFNSKVFFC